MTSSGKYASKNPKVGVNRQFQAKMPNYENRTISKTVNPIKRKFEDKAETTTCTSWVGVRPWIKIFISKVGMSIALDLLKCKT